MNDILPPPSFNHMVHVAAHEFKCQFPMDRPDAILVSDQIKPDVESLFEDKCFFPTPKEWKIHPKIASGYQYNGLLIFFTPNLPRHAAICFKLPSATETFQGAEQDKVKD